MCSERRSDRNHGNRATAVSTDEQPAHPAPDDAQPAPPAPAPAALDDAPPDDEQPAPAPKDAPVHAGSGTAARPILPRSCSPKGEREDVSDEARPPSRAARLRALILPYGPVVIVTFLLARATLRTLLAKAGEPAVPLDDAYIHFQYARSLAEGRFFSFVPGEGYTSGATSLLWPTLLAPAYALGLRGTSIIWAAWTLGFAFLALLAVETKRLAERLVDPLTAIGAGACVLAFGGYTWFAASGMEVTLLAWLLAWTARMSSEWAEEPSTRTVGRLKLLLALSLAGPLARPEGVLASGIVLGTLVSFPGPSLGRIPARAFAALAAIGPLVPPLLNKALTGHFSTTTTQVKWMIGNPYYVGPALYSAIRSNLDIFTTTLLDGREWSAIFVPQGARAVATVALLAIPVAGFRTGRGVRALLVVTLALAMALPTTYISFLWNRLRYLWPFAFAWFVGVACLGRLLADLAGAFRPRFRLAAPLVPGIAAGLLAHHLSWTMDDVATSAWAIHNQQVRLGLWARDHLPETARIGLNDTGAIAYVSGRRTFDVVGLTTPEEAKYWVAGPGSRFEHYERLALERPDRLPTHFFVYPHWMACDPVLGKELTRATVREQSILGGPTMEARLARWDLLHSGERPREEAGAIVDELDVADLESEAAHGYVVLTAWTSEQDDQVRTREYRDKTVADGGRLRRSSDRFRMTVPAQAPSRLIARWSAEDEVSLSVRVGRTTLPPITIVPSIFDEQAIDLPALPGGSTEIEVTAREGETFGSFHYWIVGR